MKKSIQFYFYSILLSSICTNLYAQNTFKIIFSKGGSKYGNSIIALDSSYLLGDYGRNTILQGIDSNGIFTYSHYFKSAFTGPGGGGTKSFFVRDSNNLIMPIAGLDSIYYLCLVSFNIQTKFYNWVTGFDINTFYGGNLPLSLNKGFNKSYVISTHKWHFIPNLQRWPIVVIADSMGQLINSYRFENHLGTAMFTHQVSNDSYITGINFTDTLGATLVRYDTSGTVLWAKTFFTRKSIFHSAVNNMDGTLTLIGCPDTNFDGTYNSYRQRLFLMKIDTSGGLLWCKQYGDSVQSFPYGNNSQVKKTIDGGYIMTGYCQPAIGKCDIFIIKTDANGDTLWTRIHGNPYTYEGGDDIVQTPDGGYIITGQSNSDQFLYSSSIVFKTDSLGMTATHCQEFNTPFEVINIPANDSNITLTITTGLISSIPSTVHDTTFVFQQKDGCHLSAIGIEEQPGKSDHGYKAIPNPNQGIFTLKNNVVTPEDVTIIVYDILGNEAINLQRINKPEPQLDLTSKPSGIYFVKIIQGNKVEVVKVVVE